MANKQRPTSPYHIPVRAYEKFMPECASNCPSTGCFSDVSENILTFTCIHCKKNTSHTVESLPHEALQELVTERMTTAEQLFGSSKEKSKLN